MLVTVRRGKLHAVAFRKRALRLAVQRDAVQTARIVTDLLAVLAFRRDQIFFLVRTFDTGVFSGLDADRDRKSVVEGKILDLGGGRII